MVVDYDHSLDTWKLDAAQIVLPLVFEGNTPKSLLDVGCGPGTWLKAARDLGIRDVLGIDGVSIPDDRLLVPKDCILKHDFTKVWNLDRVFDIALCLEVAEHLDGDHAAQLIENLVSHARTIVFSAACPGQPGYRHVNCQWPIYWQHLFNLTGYACDDSLRWQIWNDARVDFWYRQNIFVASRQADLAGKEKRLVSVVHPDLLPSVVNESRASASGDAKRRIERGDINSLWYATVPVMALWRKVRRRLRCMKS